MPTRQIAHLVKIGGGAVDGGDRHPTGGGGGGHLDFLLQGCKGGTTVQHVTSTSGGATCTHEKELICLQLDQLISYLNLSSSRHLALQHERGQNDHQ
jgi:hypothetical protein